MSKNWAGGSSRRSRLASELEAGMQVRNPESGQWRRIVEAARLESTPPQMFISLDDDSGHLIGIHETVMTREARRTSDGE